MLTSVPVCLAVGTVLGFLSGLGIGGGSLLILWLTLVLDTDPAAARMTNLLFFLPAALVALLFRWKQGAVPFRKILPAMVSGVLSAALFSWVGLRGNTQLLRKAFGLLLLLTGAKELCYHAKAESP